MTIKIAYRTEPDALIGGTRHIAEGVTPDGVQLSYTQMSRAVDIERYGAVVDAAAKRSALHNLIDDAIHRGLL